ncbi:MAG: preprotein translocase subunit TatC [Mucilaginibacter sp.]|nr:preprotein translocase subunit TatC [Mucilaginibacter sp.]
MSDNKLLNAIKDKGKTLESEMSFFEHLEALRWHLIRAAMSIVVFTSVAFWQYDFIFNDIIMGPFNPKFWTYRMMCKLGNLLHMSGWCLDKINGKIINTEMAGQFTLQINSCVMIGVILGFPYLLFEIWQFIKPALHEKERKAASGFVFYASFLFILGILFGYYIIAPESIRFLAGYTISPMIQNTFTIDSYLSSVATLTLGTGLVFELPILIYILASIGILNAPFMRRTRRYAIVLILIIAAIITPTPDMITMSVVAAPLLVLYEIGIMVAAAVGKRKALKSEELMNS